MKTDGARAKRSNVEVVIPSFNEELNISHALRSVVDWVDTVYVVDSESKDKTREIAERMGAKVVIRPWLGYAKQKNWSLDNLPLKADWIFILDADESITPELRDEILSISRQDAATVPQSGFYVNRLTYFLGRPIRHCGYFPSYNLRLFKRGKARYEDRDVHEHMMVAGQAGRLRKMMLHEDRRGLEHLIAKHNRYSTLEARELVRERTTGRIAEQKLERGVKFRRWLKHNVLPRLPLSGFWRFFYMYFLRLGFLDGAAGLRFSLLLSMYDLFIALKLAELNQTRAEGREEASATRVEGLAVPEGELSPDRVVKTNGVAVAAPAAESDGVRGFGGAPDIGTMEGGAAPPPRVGAQSPQDLLARAESPYTLKEKIARVAWTYFGQNLFHMTFHNWYGLRGLILRSFGAKLGHFVRLRPTAKFEQPWNLRIGDNSVIGDHAIIYCLGKVTIGSHVTISQNAHICAGSHDFTRPDLPLLRPPIAIGDHVWIAADAFVGPGVTVGEGVLLGARGCAVKNLDAWTIYAGNPARAIRARPKFDMVEVSIAPPVEQG